MKHRRTTVLPSAAICLLIVACGGAPDDAGTDDRPPTAEPVEQAAAAAAPGPTGDAVIAGKIVFDGEPPNLRPIDMNADPGCAARHDGPVMPQVLVLGDGKSLGNVFVQVKDPPPGTYPTPDTAAVVDQNGCMYDPHVLAVMAGQTVRFKNSDGLLHNVHGRPAVNREFNLGMPPTLTQTETSLPRPEPMFPVKCDVHPWMQVWVAVMDHPFFAVSDVSGDYRIDGLPAGDYELEAWHERLGTHTASITVGGGETATADFRFAVPSSE